MQSWTQCAPRKSALDYHQLHVTASTEPYEARRHDDFQSTFPQCETLAVYSLESRRSVPGNTSIANPNIPPRSHPPTKKKPCRLMFSQYGILWYIILRYMDMVSIRLGTPPHQQKKHRGDISSLVLNNEKIRSNKWVQTWGQKQLKYVF